MKCVVFFIACVAVVYGELSQEFKDILTEQVLNIGAKCAEITKATEDDIMQIMQRETPSTREGMCMMYCFNKEFGMQDANGKFTTEGIEKALEPFKEEDEAFYNNFMKLLTETCLPKVTSIEPCEAAVQMDTCYRENADEELKKMDTFF